jgi:replicative DNA helicase
MREVIKAGSEIATSWQSKPYNIPAYLSDAEDSIRTISQLGQAMSFYSAKQLNQNIRQHLANLKNKIFPEVIYTGDPSLDKYITFNKKETIVIGARPSMGKTALALNFGLAAAEQGKSVAIFSLEMSANKLQERLLAMTSEIDYEKIAKTGDFTPEEEVKLEAALAKLSQLSIFIDDSGTNTMPDIQLKSRQLKKIDLIIIDYIGLISSVSNKKIESRQVEIATYSRQLKALAKELDIPIIILVQISREAEKNKNQMPTMAQLKESGAIEQDADIVLLLHRPYKKSNMTEEERKKIGYSELLIAKNRNGNVGKVAMYFEGRFQKFFPSDLEVEKGGEF